jgi:cell division protease FtsH
MRHGFTDVLWVASVLLLAAGPFILLSLLAPIREGSASPLALSDLAREVKRNAIAEIRVEGNHGAAIDIDGVPHSFELGPHTTLLHVLSDLGVTPDEVTQVAYSVRDPPVGDALGQMLLSLSPMALIGVMFILASLAVTDPNAQVLGLTRHRAHRFDGTYPAIRFADVAGVDEAKQELQELVKFLADAASFAEVGARCPRGVLLVGPPGTGKTLLGRALAGEARVPFFSVAGSEFVEIIAGVGASRIRDMFDHARRTAPCILFIDELDAIGRRRGLGVSSGTSEVEQALNQLLVEMDGFESDSHIIVLAATNRADILDPALKRPGRFDRQVVVSNPDRAGREAILQVHARGKPLDPGVDLALVARMTSGLSGADLATIMNESAILAARHGKPTIAMADVEAAIERVLLGPVAISRPLPDAELSRRAYHEAGCGLVAAVLEQHPPVHKLTILSYGQTPGHMRCAEPEDPLLATRGQLLARLTATLAGPAAERLVFPDEASGSERDFSAATQIAELMVKRYGMSSSLGPVSLDASSWSDSTARLVDDEIRRLIDHANADALSILTAHRGRLERVAAALLQHETLEGEGLQRLLGNEPA